MLAVYVALTSGLEPLSEMVMVPWPALAPWSHVHPSEPGAVTRLGPSVAWPAIHSSSFSGAFSFGC